METIFTGDMDKLRKYWEDPKRAKKFQKGGTRVLAVDKVLSILNKYIKDGIWLDVATGAGFVQTRCSVEPCLFVGIDLSIRMLRSQINPFGERVAASAFSLPFRANSANIVSIFFSLSDYPDLEPKIKALSLPLTGGSILSFVDYNIRDQYWIERKKMHGKVVNGQRIVGNINLRSIDEIQQSFPDALKIIHSEEIEVKVPNTSFLDILPDLSFVNRVFSFVLGQMIVISQ